MKNIMYLGKGAAVIGLLAITFGSNSVKAESVAVCSDISSAVKKIQADSNQNKRIETAMALDECIYGMSADEKKAVSNNEIDMLADLLKSSDEGVRGAGAIALGNLGSRAKRALPKLRVALDESKHVQPGRIGPSVGPTSAILKAIEKITTPGL